jgi:hypothetical protein
VFSIWEKFSNPDKLNPKLKEKSEGKNRKDIR